MLISMKCWNAQILFSLKAAISNEFSRNGLFIQPSASLSCILSWEPKQCWHAPFFTDQAFIPRTYVLKFPFQSFKMLTFVHQEFPSNPNLIFHKSHSRVRSLIKCLAKALMRIFLQFIFTNRAMRLLMMARMLFRHIDAPFEIYLKKQTFYMNRIIYIYLACSYFLPVSANHSNSA